MAQKFSVYMVFTTLLFLLYFLKVSSLLSPTSANTITTLAELNNATDRIALLSFKSIISSDPGRSLASWNNSIHFCQWTGVTCGGRQTQRVISLDLSSLALTGEISPAIGNLTFLKWMDLSNNQFHGSIPEEIGGLFRLQHVNLSVNSLQGGIPDTLSHCSQLQNLSMRYNMLSGEIPLSLGDGCLDLRTISLKNNSFTGHIPPSLTNLSSLLYLDLNQNQISGGIPPEMGNLNSLVVLDLTENQLSGGIPPSLGKLSKLESLVLSVNNLSGVIPLSIWNLSSLSYLYLGLNNLSGLIPQDACQSLPLLEKISLINNHFHGPLPISLSNASFLEYIELGGNRFSGSIPANLGSLINLQWLTLDQNQLESREPYGWRFLSNLANCTNLNFLSLDDNNLSGMLPNSIVNLSTNLQYLSMANNRISANISPHIGNFVHLSLLSFAANLLDGSIPNSIGMLQNLITLDLHSNKLYGEIPSTLGNLSQLNYMFLDFNNLTGSIPAQLGNCQNLNVLNLRSNLLTGSIPKQVLTIPSLTRGLSLASNMLTGPIPREVGSLINSEVIDLSMNKLSGEIPSTLGDCQVLQQLILNENSFQGNIPSSLGLLRGIQVIDFSHNNFSGKIPNLLQDFHDLYYLDLSFNNFEGEVPRLGIFKNVSEVTLIGNNKLCGGNPDMHLPVCPSQFSPRKHTFHTLAVILPIAISSLFLFVLFCLLVVRYSIRKSRKRTLESVSTKERHVRITYDELLGATNNFSTENLVGKGSFGAVYKGILEEFHDSMKCIAVKVLNLQIEGASKSFVAECEALRNIRHRNLVKIITTCLSTDFSGNDFKAVIFEFMENGSLDDWLDPKANKQLEPKNLTFIQRLNIVIDVASALDYLHHYCEPPIVHCDLKPSNILLDNDMTAHVGDFGLARFVDKIVSKSSQFSESSTGLKGTIGYVAPEYGMTNKVSTRGDVYSYGILLLEMFTARRPTDELFTEGLTLRKFVEMAFPERVGDVIDSHLLRQEDDARIVESIASVLRISLLCSNEVPNDRTEMRDIVTELHHVRDVFLKK